MLLDSQPTFEQVPAYLAHLAQDFNSLRESLLGQSNSNEIEPPIDVDEARIFIKSENVQTLYRMVREGRIPFHKKGSRLYFYKSELNAWIKSEKENLVTQ